MMERFSVYAEEVYRDVWRGVMRHDGIGDWVRYRDAMMKVRLTVLFSLVLGIIIGFLFGRH